VTETEWLACDNPGPMLDYVRQTIRVGFAEGRKNYLLAAACGRLIWDQIEDERLRLGVTWAEEFADDVDDVNARGEVTNGVWSAYSDVHGSTAGGIRERKNGEFEIALAVTRIIQKTPIHAAGDLLFVSGNAAGLNPAGGSPLPGHLRQPIPPDQHRPTLADLDGA
jgi:hypothetical protein